MLNILSLRFRRMQLEKDTTSISIPTREKKKEESREEED